MPRVERVSNTNLFARLTEQGQLLVYQMTYLASEPVAMILPIPIALAAKDDAVRFIDLKGYPEFFGHLNEAFPVPRAQHYRGAIPASVSSRAQPMLRVESVGDFEASFVPSPADFKRLDPRFKLPKETFEKLPEYNDYGFVVFQFKEKGGTPHPMAFEFPTRLVNTLFYPTVHIHDGEIHEKESFDHTLYLQNGGSHGDASAGDAGRYVDVARAQGIVLGEAPLRRVKLAGMLPNTDTLLDTNQNLKRSGWIGAGIGAALLGGYFFQKRRERL
ncbi:MAG: hypothetical protein QM758_22300 [Armatimonas sp.]